MDEKAILKELLENVSDTYYDFVMGTLLDAENIPDGYNKLIKKIQQNPDMNSVDIINYTDDLEGIPRVDTSKIPNLDMNKLK